MTRDIPSIFDDGSRNYSEAWVSDSESMRIVEGRRQAEHRVAAVEATADD